MCKLSIFERYEDDPQKHKYSRVLLFYPIPPGEQVETNLEERFTEVQQETIIQNLRLTVVDYNERALFKYLIRGRN